MEEKKPKNSPARIRANNKYAKNHYERIALLVPKGIRERYRAEATKQGYTSLNAFIKDAIEEKIKHPVK